VNKKPLVLSIFFREPFPKRFLNLLVPFPQKISIPPVFGSKIQQVLDLKPSKVPLFCLAHFLDNCSETMDA
jgi:hypothetical protein